MAHLRCDFFSDVLGLSTSMTVLLPQASAGQIGLPAVSRRTDPPVLYLLHGLSDDDTAWTRRTALERYVAPLGLAVVMPQVHRSFYTDEAAGLRFWTFLTGELPAVVARFFRVSTRREDTFVAGLSMGGYGALKWALRQPERFAAAASLSGALDVGRLQALRGTAEDPRLAMRIFGDDPAAGSDHDLMHLLASSAPASAPSLYVACGDDDPLRESNVAFVDSCRRRDLAVTTAFGPGAHDWAYWDARIQDVLAWLPLEPAPA